MTLTVEQFGHELIRTGDLDPIYVMLHRARLPAVQLSRWVAAYWCFYDAGTCCRILDRIERGEGVWTHYAVAAANADRSWRRGSERRHFRGDNAAKAIGGLYDRYQAPEDFVAYCAADTFNEISARVQEHKGFGPWIAFKAADMYERVLGHRVEFPPDVLGWYKEPAAGAELVAVEKGWKSEDRASAVVNYLLNRFSTTAAPPQEDRAAGIQEIETILCKYKAHHAGHYPVGKDIREIRHTLALTARDHHSNLAAKLLDAMPEEVHA